MLIKSTKITIAYILNIENIKEKKVTVTPEEVT